MHEKLICLGKGLLQFMEEGTGLLIMFTFLELIDLIKISGMGTEVEKSVPNHDRAKLFLLFFCYFVVVFFYRSGIVKEAWDCSSAEQIA